MKGASKVLIALAAVAITMGAIWHSNRVVPPKEATWDDVKAEARQGGYQLITTDELSRQYTAKPESPASRRYPPGMGIPHRSY